MKHGTQIGPELSFLMTQVALIPPHNFTAHCILHLNVVIFPCLAEVVCAAHSADESPNSSLWKIITSGNTTEELPMWTCWKTERQRGMCIVHIIQLSGFRPTTWLSPVVSSHLLLWCYSVAVFHVKLPNRCGAGASTGNCQVMNRRSHCPTVEPVTWRSEVTSERKTNFKPRGICQFCRQDFTHFQRVEVSA